MTLPTVSVTFTAHDQNGNPVANAPVQAKLDKTEIYQGFIAPEQVEATTNSNGVAILNLWPNALGTAGSKYRIRAWNPDTQAKFLDVTVVIPNSNCSLEQALVQAPFPSVDASQQALIAAQGALTLVTAQAQIATTKATAASTSASDAATSATSAASSASAAAGSAASAATSQANASASASLASTKAANASASATAAETSAQTATDKAAVATTKASEATTAATNASSSATSASTGAATATSKAAEASASASSSGDSATAANNYAGIASTKASEAGDKAATALGAQHAAEAAASDALRYRNAASDSAASAQGTAQIVKQQSDAVTELVRATAADRVQTSLDAAATAADRMQTGVDRQNASASATAAAVSSSTASTQAGIATAKASDASASASAAEGSASTAAAQASAATTKASEAAASAATASTAATTATTKAGESAASATAAANSYDAFDDRYLGAKSTAPAVDNDGQALLVGALYWDTGLSAMRAWSGSSWIDVNELDGRLLADQQLLGAVSYATDMALQAVREIMRAEPALQSQVTALSTNVSGYDLLIEQLTYQATHLAELAGVIGRAISGGTISLQGGTAAIPSLTSNTDVTSGLFFPSPGVMALATASLERMRITADGRLGIGTTAPSGLLDVADSKIRIRTAQTPASAAAAGNQGEIAWDASFVYVCTATNTWKRAALATW